MSSSSSTSSSNANYNSSHTTTTSAAVANNNNNNNIHSFVTSLSEGEDNNLNHNPHNNTGQQHFTANGEVGGGNTLSIPSTTTSTSLTANDLTNLSNLQVAAAWNQHHTSQHHQNLTTLNVVGQSGTGGMSSSHM